jgi:hypothetical protein
MKNLPTYQEYLIESISDLEGNEKDMVEGIAEILRSVTDESNRLKIALKQIENFKKQKIDFDYSEFMSLCNLKESKIVETVSPINGPLLKTSSVGDVVHVDGKALTIKEVIKERDGSMIEFTAISNAGQTYKVIYDDGRDGYVLDEFEGSTGPTESPASDLFLATQTAANGIAF